MLHAYLHIRHIASIFLSVGCVVRYTALVRAMPLPPVPSACLHSSASQSGSAPHQPVGQRDQAIPPTPAEGSLRALQFLTAGRGPTASKRVVEYDTKDVIPHVSRTRRPPPPLTATNQRLSPRGVCPAAARAEAQPLGGGAWCWRAAASPPRPAGTKP
jgi:hypothetical protein